MRLFALFFVVFASSAFAKDFSTWRTYTQASLVTETTAFTPGAIGTLGLKIHLADRWHTYWVNPGDSGTPFRLTFKTSRGVKVERVLFPIPEREQTGPLISFAYFKDLLIPIELKISDSLSRGRPVSIDVDVEWLVCVDVCIPAFDSLHIDVPLESLDHVTPSGEFDLFQKTRALIPQMAQETPPFAIEGNAGKWTIPAAHTADEFVEFFPFKSSGVNNVKPTRTGDVLQFEKANVAAASSDRVGVLVMRAKDSGKLQAYQYGNSGWSFDVKKTSDGRELLWMLVSAFIGGLILNLMPCVFPILSIKLLSLIKLGKAHAREVRQQNIAYSAGVMISFIGIALVLSVLRSAGNLVGWGFQLQSPVFLAILTWLFFALSLNLLGVFEIDFLNGNWGHSLTKNGGMAGSFFTGVLAVVVASPCTAPFMGVALGFGLAQPTPVLIAIFAMLGLGLAFPYLLFVIFPQMTQFMPRPGKWMQTLKQVMAVPLLLTTVWMLWILGQVRGPNAITAVLVGCVALGLALFLKRGSLKAIAVLVLLCGAAFIYRSESVAVMPAAGDANGLWIPYSEAKLGELKGKNVFINMTADWCLSCKVNERLVFDDAEVQALMKAKNVTWMKGDWTQRNEEITRFLNRYDRVGVPFYVLYSLSNPAGTPLPEVLTKSSFMDFLNKEFP